MDTRTDTRRERRDEKGRLLARRCDEHGGFTKLGMATCPHCQKTVCASCARDSHRHVPCPALKSRRLDAILGPAIRKTLARHA